MPISWWRRKNGWPSKKALRAPNTRQSKGCGGSRWCTKGRLLMVAACPGSTRPSSSGKHNRHRYRGREMDIVRRRPLVARRSAKDSCEGCKVSYIHQRPPDTQRTAPLTDLEIAQIREVFQTCPIARRVTEGPN